MVASRVIGARRANSHLPAEPFASGVGGGLDATMLAGTLWRVDVTRACVRATSVVTAPLPSGDAPPR